MRGLRESLRRECPSSVDSGLTSVTSSSVRGIRDGPVRPGSRLFDFTGSASIQIFELTHKLLDFRSDPIGPEVSK